MKLTIQHVQVRSTDRIDSQIEERILALEPVAEIDEVRVRLECRWEESPGFYVQIQIVAPGPDWRVESTDHTLEAAIAKAVDCLERRIRANAGSRLRRWRGRRKTGLRHCRRLKAT